MKKLSVISMMALLALFFVATLSLSSCSGNDQDDEMEDEATEEVAEESDEMDDAAAMTSGAAATSADSEVKEHVAEDKTVIKYRHDRATYQASTLAATDAAVTSDGAAVAEAPFDVAPVFGPDCKTAPNPEQCTHEKLGKYLSSNLKVPEEVDEVKGTHREIVSFVVLPDGSIKTSDIRFVASENNCPKCAAEALRLVKEMPNWVPATKEGTPVEARVTVPIVFDIQ